jgi:hypothetical protein
MRPLIAHCHLGIGRVHRELGQRRSAGEHGDRAAAMYRDMGLAFWLDQTQAERDSRNRP